MSVDNSLKMKALQTENAELKAILKSSLDKLIENEKIGRVFHDFNNILSSSMGYANLALDRAKESSDEKLTRYLDNIERAGIRSRDLVRESIESRRVVRDIEQVELVGLSHPVFNQVNSKIPSAIRVHYTAEQLETLCRLLFAGFDYAGAEISAEVVEEFTCESCHEDLRGLQLKMKVEGLEPVDDIDANNFPLAAALVNSQAGHLCESLMQDKQFVVYLRSVVPESSQS